MTAVDSSPEVNAINADRLHERLGAVPVRFVVADLFRWQPDRQYDTIFFSHWLSHVPTERLESFWSMAHAALAPGGRVFFVDARYDETSTAKDHELEGPDAQAVTRRLNDGQEYRIVKVFYRPEDLAQRLTAWGWRGADRTDADLLLPMAWRALNQNLPEAAGTRGASKCELSRHCNAVHL